MNKDIKDFLKVIVLIALMITLGVISLFYFENKEGESIKNWSEYKCLDLAKSYGLKNVDVKCLPQIHLGYSICSINSDKKIFSLKCFKNDDVCMLQSSVDLK